MHFCPLKLVKPGGWEPLNPPPGPLHPLAMKSSILLQKVTEESSSLPPASSEVQPMTPNLLRPLTNHRWAPASFPTNHFRVRTPLFTAPVSDQSEARPPAQRAGRENRRDGQTSWGERRRQVTEDQSEDRGGSSGQVPPYQLRVRL